MLSCPGSSSGDKTPPCHSLEYWQWDRKEDFRHDLGKCQGAHSFPSLFPSALSQRAALQQKKESLCNQIPSKVSSATSVAPTQRSVTWIWAVQELCPSDRSCGARPLGRQQGGLFPALETRGSSCLRSVTLQRPQLSWDPSLTQVDGATLHSRTPAER